MLKINPLVIELWGDAIQIQPLSMYFNISGLYLKGKRGHKMLLHLSIPFWFGRYFTLCKWLGSYIQNARRNAYSPSCVSFLTLDRFWLKLDCVSTNCNKTWLCQILRNLECIHYIFGAHHCDSCECIQYIFGAHHCNSCQWIPILVRRRM